MQYSKNRLKTFFINILTFTYMAVRPILGPKGVCIYPISCGEYAKTTLQNKSILLAIPLIVLRVLSCNPITAFFLILKQKNQNKGRNHDNQ